MSDELLIRSGQRSDIETLARFNIAQAWETEKKRLEPAVATEGVQAVFNNPRHGFYTVAELAGQVVGCAMITYEWSDWRCGLFWWIQSVYVSPHSRRQGVFQQLYRFVRTKASEESNVCGIRLYVEQSNHPAQCAYAALGMEETSYRVYETPMPYNSRQ